MFRKSARMRTNSKSASPTLFLDFDGVLHPNGAQVEDYFCRVDFLALTIAEFDLDVVISSSWRFHLSFKRLLEYFPEPFRGKISGVTGEACIGRNSRWKELQEYIRVHGNNNWRALDDSGFEFPPECPELILCDGARGVQERDLTTLRRWLAAERPPCPSHSFPGS